MLRRFLSLYVYVCTSLSKCTESDKEVSLTLNVYLSPLTQDSDFSIAEQIKYICVGCLLVRIYVQGCLLKHYIHFFVAKHYILQMCKHLTLNSLRGFLLAHDFSPSSLAPLFVVARWDSRQEAERQEGLG